MDGVHSFFEGLGGRTKNIRIDNLSACVARVLELLLTERRPSLENVITIRPLKLNLSQYDLFIPQSKKEKIK